MDNKTNEFDDNQDINLNEETIDVYYFYEKDFENKLCVDCRGPLPDYVSINNAVILCKTCALEHQKLGYSISYIRAIKDGWDSYLLGFMERGGNGRFLQFANNKKIAELPISLKYSTRFCQYYRLLLRSEALAEEPPEEPTNQQGFQKCDLEIDYFPEFENYELYNGTIDLNRTNGGLRQKLSQSLTNVKEKLEESHLGEKLKLGSLALFKALTTTGGLLFSASVPVANFIGKTTYKGVGYTYNYLTGNKETPKQNEKNEKFESFSIKEEEIDNNSSKPDFSKYVKGNKKEEAPAVKKEEKEPDFNLTYQQSSEVPINKLLRKPNYVVNNPCQIRENTILYDYEIRKENNFEPKYQFVNTNKIKARKDANNYLFK